MSHMQAFDFEAAKKDLLIFLSEWFQFGSNQCPQKREVQLCIVRSLFDMKTPRTQDSKYLQVNNKTKAGNILDYISLADIA